MNKLPKVDPSKIKKLHEGVPEGDEIKIPVGVWGGLLLITVIVLQILMGMGYL